MGDALRLLLPEDSPELRHLDFIAACASGNMQKVSTYFQSYDRKNPAIDMHTPFRGQTAMHRALSNGHEEVVIFLLVKKFDINIPGGEEEPSMLTFAVLSRK